MEERKSKTFPPVYDSESKILILGTAPSPKSCEVGFFYGHPQNRFWKVLAGICGCEVPETIAQKKEMLLRNHIAVWDVIDECDITGSADSSIRNVVVNDFSAILAGSKIRRIYANGTKAKQIYDKYVEAQTGIKIQGLPSTSPLNARYNLNTLYEEWKRIIGEI